MGFCSAFEVSTQRSIKWESVSENTSDQKVIGNETNQDQKFEQKKLHWYKKDIIMKQIISLFKFVQSLGVVFSFKKKHVVR